MPCVAFLDRPLPLLWTSFALLGVAIGLNQSSPVFAAEPPVSTKTISLTIDYGDGAQKAFPKLPWKEKLTAWEALQAAAKHPRGIKLMHRGSGATTLVTAIDDLANEGRGRNWLFDVNGKLAEKSCGIVELQAGDAVLWRFAEYQ